jgi:hypothetical protein
VEIHTDSSRILNGVILCISDRYEIVSSFEHSLPQNLQDSSNTATEAQWQTPYFYSQMSEEN